MYEIALKLHSWYSLPFLSHPLSFSRFLPVTPPPPSHSSILLKLYFSMCFFARMCASARVRKDKNALQIELSAFDVKVIVNVNGNEMKWMENHQCFYVSLMLFFVFSRSFYSILLWHLSVFCCILGAHICTDETWLCDDDTLDDGY